MSFCSLGSALGTEFCTVITSILFTHPIMVNFPLLETRFVSLVVSTLDLHSLLPSDVLAFLQVTSPPSLLYLSHRFLLLRLPKTPVKDFTIP